MSTNKIPNVLLVCTGQLPVPDVKGGAIERLVMMLIEDNEKYQRMNLTVATCSDDAAIEIQGRFNHTRFLNYPHSQTSRFHKYIAILNRWFVKYLNKPGFCDNVFFRSVEQYVRNNKEKIDFVVAEGNCLYDMCRISSVVGKERMCAHLHGNVDANVVLDHLFGNVCTVSDFISNKYLQNTKLPKTSVITVFNGIDLHRFEKKITEEEKDSLRLSLNIKKDDFVVIFCGRIVPQKGVKELIKAIIAQNNSKIKLLILGASNFGLGDFGEYPKEVKALIDQNSDMVRFTGFVRNEDIYKYHQISNIGAVPSTYHDPCPLSMCELIASGLPTIATAAGGMTEIGTPDTTLFVSLDNLEEDLSAGIKKLFENEQIIISMKKHAMERRAYFSRERFYCDFCDGITLFVENRCLC